LKSKKNAVPQMLFFGQYLFFWDYIAKYYIGGWAAKFS